VLDERIRCGSAGVRPRRGAPAVVVHPFVSAAVKDNDSTIGRAAS